MVDRPYLVVSTAALAGSGAPDARLRLISDDEFDALGLLFVEAYRGTVDDEGETPEDGAEVVRDTADGDNGPAVREAWFAIDGPDGAGGTRAVSAVFPIIWRGLPFISFVVTHPDSQGQGLASTLLRSVAAVFRDRGETELWLGVAGSSPALELYKHLGFVEQPRPGGDDD